jgi:hypothetical protein
VRTLVRGIVSKKADGGFPQVAVEQFIVCKSMPSWSSMSRRIEYLVLQDFGPFESCK